ncbi:hypothetical protein Ddye_011623 [Dipteronia dyeriana]|uniref:Pentatricopeptide repeat-containing protein n=1 Tax=Dipteronia dyeriana TaxID=168575 RepID=A0AAD9X2Y4_9ROSI|nr:hypothetical protein Ddye_011623 [Dipteronia dyeriana]
MALLIFARRLQRSHQRPLLLPALIHSHQFCSFSLAFRRTLSIPSQTSILSSLHLFSTTTLNNPFALAPPVTRTRDPQESVLLETLKRVAQVDSEAHAMACLDESGISANSNLVYSMIWELREVWRLAYLAFNWGHKWGSVDEKVCELMVWVLGGCRKFNIAWCLIRDTHKSYNNTRRAMLVMIDRYAAANDPGKAIWTFHIMDKFRITPDEEAFLFLLNSLCEYGNVEEAEEFMLISKKLFPLETEGFNIILNGWCNIFVDVFEAKRIWREMSKCCITPNATSYTHMISCFSKVGNLFDSMRLYDEMKKRGWVPGLKVYNSLVYVLTSENCFKEALKVLEKMKAMGLQPDCATYNSMILPLCEAKRLNEARNILATMTAEKHNPTIETYHAFIEGVGYEGTIEVFNRMRRAGLGPNGDTFVLVLGKFFKLEQPENALKIWTEMEQYEVVPNSAHYRLLVEGLASCGLLLKAKEYYAEMTSFGFLDDPKLRKLLKEPARGGKDKQKQRVEEAMRDRPKKLRKSNKTRRIKDQRQSRKRKTVIEEFKSKP